MKIKIKTLEEIQTILKNLKSETDKKYKIKETGTLSSGIKSKQKRKQTCYPFESGLFMKQKIKRDYLKDILEAMDDIIKKDIPKVKPLMGEICKVVKRNE
ncbi:MAG: hypothetical protein ABIN23_05760 [candidate division WOR-3 bacterium]